MRTHCFLLAAATALACAPAGERAAVGNDAAAPTRAAAEDPDVQTAGGGVPTGYRGQVDPPRGDRAPADIGGANYTMEGNRWVVRTGPAHIVWSADDTASGNYTATATIEQMESPQHPEAFGLLIGGQNLDDIREQRYTYFIVRHTGEYMVRVREGETLRTVADWSANPAVPRSDSVGRARYQLAARVAADSVRFLVNDQQVASAPRSAVLVDGAAGVRINHNLHVTVTPVRITR